MKLNELIEQIKNACGGKWDENREVILRMNSDRSDKAKQVKTENATTITISN